VAGGSFLRSCMRAGGQRHTRPRRLLEGEVLHMELFRGFGEAFLVGDVGVRSTKKILRI
jgi:hypothetical protein